MLRLFSFIHLLVVVLLWSLTVQSESHSRIDTLCYLQNPAVQTESLADDSSLQSPFTTSRQIGAEVEQKTGIVAGASLKVYTGD